MSDTLDETHSTTTEMQLRSARALLDRLGILQDQRDSLNSQVSNASRFVESLKREIKILAWHWNARHENEWHYEDLVDQIENYLNGSFESHNSSQMQNLDLKAILQGAMNFYDSNVRLMLVQRRPTSNHHDLRERCQQHGVNYDHFLLSRRILFTKELLHDVKRDLARRLIELSVVHDDLEEIKNQIQI